VVERTGRRLLEFPTRDGRTVRTAERQKSGEAQPSAGAQVPIHYDRTDPATVVTDESHTGRDVTLWIVAVKLVIGGAVLAVFGARRLRRRRRHPRPAPTCLHRLKNCRMCKNESDVGGPGWDGRVPLPGRPASTAGTTQLHG